MAIEKEEAENLDMPKVEITADEPDTVIQPDAPEPKKRGRGRPAGTSTKTEAPKKSAGKKAADSEEFANQLMGIHMLVAMATGLPELAIGEGESRILAKAINAMTEEYGFALNGKTGAAIQMFGAAAMVYLPRAFAIKKRVQDEQEKQAATEAANTLDGNGLVNSYVNPNVPNH